MSQLEISPLGESGLPAQTMSISAPQEISFRDDGGRGACDQVQGRDPYLIAFTFNWFMVNDGEGRTHCPAAVRHTEVFPFRHTHIEPKPTLFSCISEFEGAHTANIQATFLRFFLSSRV